MKLDKYIRTFLLLSVIPGFMSCHKADEVKLGDKSAVLDMTAQLFNSASDKVWQGILSANQDSIYFDIPYYLSDTAGSHKAGFDEDDIAGESSFRSCCDSRIGRSERFIQTLSGNCAGWKRHATCVCNLSPSFEKR